MRPLSFFCSPSASPNDRLSTPSSFTRLRNDSHSPPVRQYVSADSADRYMVFAQDSFLRNCDRWIYPSRFGTAMANKMLRMTSVTASSTRVKPPFPRRFVMLAASFPFRYRSRGNTAPIYPFYILAIPFFPVKHRRHSSTVSRPFSLFSRNLPVSAPQRAKKAAGADFGSLSAI